MSYFLHAGSITTDAGLNESKMQPRIYHPGIRYVIKALKNPYHYCWYGNRFYPHVADLPKSSQVIRSSAQAGFLTSGSTYWSHLPTTLSNGGFVTVIPVYSGGSVPDFHRIPFYLLFAAPG